jgi:hypothetical protein
MALNDDARALAEVMIASGREPLWCVLVVGWYFGSEGRQAALALIEQHGRNTGEAEGVVPS